MLIKDEDFRNLYKSYVIIKDDKFSRQIAQTLLINTILEDNPTDKDLKEKIDSIPIDGDINAIFAVPYIDHTAGMSFLVLSTASLNGKNVVIKKREKFDTLSNTRKESVNDFEFEYLENLNVNGDFDLEHYSEYAKIANSYFINENVEMLRFADILDNSRHENFPDDVEVLLIKKDLQIEKIWVRYEDLAEDKQIIATLLNEPFQDFEVHAGEKIKFFPYKDNDKDEWVLICDLNS